MRFQVQIYVTLRPSVLDPAGAALEAGLHQLGHTQVQHVRIGKYIQLQLEAQDPTQAQTQAQQLCDQLLANPVIETYRIDVTPDLSAVPTVV